MDEISHIESLWVYPDELLGTTSIGSANEEPDHGGGGSPIVDDQERRYDQCDTRR